jgi:hypothetical protein
MSNLVIALLSAATLFAIIKWFKWKIMALTVIAFCEDKYREPTTDEVVFYAKFILKRMLHIEDSKKKG